MFTTPKGRPTLCFIDLEALRWNYHKIKEKVGPRIKIASMVKANAYGHGAPCVARALAEEGCDAFGVATLEEGIELRQAEIRSPIIVLAGVYLEQLDQFFEHELIPVVHEIDGLRRLDAAVQSRGTSLNVHLKIDTGMGRIGLLAAEIGSWLPELKKLKSLKIDGVYPSPAMIGQIALKPVLSWKTSILQLKKVSPGTSISYGQTFITQRESLIATLPIGYADGYPRLLSNRGEVLVRGQRAPVVGRVCMDLTMIDVTDIGETKPGDEVVLLGRQGNAEISTDEMAAWSNTISYEILTSIGARVPRIYYHSKEER